MARFKFKVETNFNREQIAINLVTKLKKTLLETMVSLEKHARREVPVRTGKLRASLNTKPLRPAAKIITGDGVEYGRFVELGTSRQAPNPFLRRALMVTKILDIPRILKKNKLT